MAKTEKKPEEAKEPDIKLSSEQEAMVDKLTRLQRRFVLFLVGSNMSQRQAYLAAGGTAKSEDSQDAAASRMLSDVRVKVFYDSLMKEAQTDAVMSKSEALERLTKQARIKITDICTFRYIEIEDAKTGELYVNTVWEMKNAEDIDPDIAACIKSVTFTKMGPKIELYDSNQTIKLMADMLGWNAPKSLDHASSDGSMSPNKTASQYSDDELAKIVES